MKIPTTPPDYVAEVLNAEPKKLSRILNAQPGPAPDGKYRHWDTLRHITPPDGLTSEEWWAAIKFARQSLFRQVPLLDKAGKPFQFATVDPVLAMLHKVDRDASGQIRIEDEVTNPQSRDRYILNSLIEEAITSSQLEGASTTAQVARDMIRSGRRPSDKSEQMIFNNYRAMELVRTLKDDPLTVELIFRIHSTLTLDTLEDKTAAGRFRTASEDVFVTDQIGNRLHEPPPADELINRVNALCKFANQTLDEPFIHPVIRAIIIHFWLAYDHPFIDGNGRTARALFYWSMLSQGFWLFEYLSISHILRKAPSRYARSFLYTETDANDLTYFILSQLQVICDAISELHNYLNRKIEEVRNAERIFRTSGDLNHRQLALLSHALRHPSAIYTIESHRRSHSITYETARTDLLELVQCDLLQKKKRGRAFVFICGPALSQPKKVPA